MPHVPYTTLGIAASSSTRNATGWRSQRGENSVRKIATLSASGTARTSANSPPPEVSQPHLGRWLMTTAIRLLGLPDRPAAGGHSLQARLNPRTQLLRQRRVAQLRRFGLARSLGPPNELHERPRLRAVGI